MTGDARAALRKQLIRHEGLRLLPYRDTVGLLTIGCGRNIEARGITEAEAMFLLDNDIDLCVRQLTAKFIWFQELDSIRQRAMVDLCFNMGIAGLSNFRTALAAMGRDDFDAAANAFQDSAWFRQVKSRGPRVVHMIRTGTEPN
jgi:lysozyme